MSDKKGDLKIKSDFFELKINRDLKAMPFQGSVIIGLVCLYFLSDKPAIHTFCIILGLIDLISIIIYTLNNLHVETEEEVTEEKPVDPSVTEAPDVQVEHNQSASSTKVSESKISNKVPVPNPSKAPAQEMEPQAEEVQPPPRPQSTKDGGEPDIDPVDFWDDLFNTGDGNV